MQPQRYTVQIGNKFTTVRTCNGATGAYVGVSGEKLATWKVDKDNPRKTIVNGCVVTELL